MGRLILTSFGLHTPLGYELISENIRKENLLQKTILLITLPEYEIDDKLIRACKRIGFEEENIFILKPENAAQIREKAFEVIYVSEGNTFEILAYIRQCAMVSAIKRNVQNGAEYIGASAGAYIAGSDIETALPFDRNRINMADYKALELFKGAVIPHYDASEMRRYLAYKAAKESGKYELVYTVGNNEVVVMD